jgi:hypothetical protein
MTDDADTTIKDFHRAVNMTADQITKWLETDDSKAVGQKEGSGESVGHRSGRRIVKLLGTAKDDLTPGDLAHMTKVVGYVNRHSKQRPDGDITDTRWRFSLMNWGHDPKKK